MYTFHTTVRYTFLYIICILHVLSRIQIGADSPLSPKSFWIVWNDKIIFVYFEYTQLMHVSSALVVRVKG